MKTLIVATDFSEEAENAAAYAAGLARRIHSKVVLFNAFTVPLHAANARLPASSIDILEDHNRVLLEEKASKLSVSFGIEVHYESSFLTSVYEGLDELVEKHNAGCIVMGMAAKSLGQDLFGNTTTSVITKLKHPVLAVPTGSRFGGISKILFACEAYEEVPAPVIGKVKSLASGLGAEIELFHVSEATGSTEDDARAREGLEEGLRDVSHYYKDVASDAVIGKIAEELRASKADLLIMMPKHYGFWESLVHRSKTRVMASNNEVPLLSIPL